MAKTKKKAPAIDVLYRIIMAGMAICIPIAAVFSKFYYVVVESSALQLLSQLSGQSQEDTGATLFNNSLYETYERYFSTAQQSDGTGVLTKAWEVMSASHSAIVTTLVFFALALVLALVVFFFACFSGKKLVPLCLSAGGIVSLIVMRVAFNSAAAPLLDGSISIADLIGGTGASLLSSISSLLAQVSIFRLDSAWFVMLFLFAGMLLWAAAYMLIEAGEKSKKK